MGQKSVLEKTTPSALNNHQAQGKRNLSWQISGRVGEMASKLCLVGGCNRVEQFGRLGIRYTDKNLGMFRMILERRWQSVFVVALVLLLPAAGIQAEPSDLDRVEQLDEVEVTAARIAPTPRVFPPSLPDLSTAVSLPADPFWKRGAPAMPESSTLSPLKLLRDDTAVSRGTRIGPAYLEYPKPAYPKRAQKAGLEGRVWLEVAVWWDGSVADVKLKESSGHRLLDETAIAAVHGWRFVPAKDGAFEIPGIATVPVRFTLTDPAEDEPLQ